MRRTLLLTALLLGLPASAHAATVSQTRGVARLRAAHGERNDVVVSQTPTGLLRLRDRGARLQVRGACKRIDAHTARCGPTEAPRLFLGDEDDAASVRLPRAVAASVSGGGGDDVLRGGPEVDRFSGGPGRDRLRGGRGQDRLVGGKGADRLFAWGDDTADTLDCGTGADEVVSESLDTVSDCETLTAFEDQSLELDVLPVADSNSADFTLRCTQSAEASCLGALTLTGPDGEAYGSGSYAVAQEGGARAVAVPLTEAGKAAIRAGARLVVDVAAGDEVYGFRLVLP